ncbi:hypothetical protein [Aureispira anguillae]|uniref:Uncharacterized protein n=1 Tax=Aureispira anguillae TaxID=2864201 RepID=A0A915YGD5_9BACT|nr:hypothetical protein [Aureispira anguillae]BDS12659.1 hypothetical protein AsAng_0033830 [Aureispira anguillae]
MEHSNKVISINLLVFIIYTLILHTTGIGDPIRFSGFVAFIHAAAIFIIGAIFALIERSQKEKKSLGLSMILAALVILTIGFSACLGSLMV